MSENSFKSYFKLITEPDISTLYERLQESVLFNNTEDLSYSELKNMTEGRDYLNYTEHEKRLPDEVFRSSLNRLEKEDRIDRHLCAPRTGKRRICYSLTESRRRKMEIKLNEYFATYSLILLSELYGASPKYELTSEIIKDFLKNQGIDLSSNKLIEIGKSGITTLYKPIKYIQVVKEIHEIAELKKNDTIPRIRIEEHYYYRVIGLSVKDILEKRKAIRDKINKRCVPKARKKTRIIDILNSYPINENSYDWYLVDEKINEDTINEAFSKLKKHNMIIKLGTYKGEPRYSLRDDLYSLLNHCLAIKEEILLMLEHWWKHNYPPDNEAKRWLEFFYPRSQVLADLKSYGIQRQHTPHSTVLRNKKIEEMKRETEFAITRYNTKIDYLKTKFEKVIKKYHGPLLTDFIQLTTNPLVFRNLLKYVRKNTSIYQLSLWEQ